MTLSYTTFGAPKYHAEVRAQLVAYISARSERCSAGQNDFEGYLILPVIIKHGVVKKNYKHLQSYTV